MDNPINYWYQKYIALKTKVDEMMNEAVEAEVESFSDMHPEVSVPLNPTVLKAGDKVRIIIVKEDE